MYTRKCPILACFFTAPVFVSGCTDEETDWIEYLEHGTLSAWNSTTDEYDIYMSDQYTDFT